jgi:tetratricopeptide (TPR) repeat protein
MSNYSPLNEDLIANTPVDFLSKELILLFLFVAFYFIFKYLINKKTQSSNNDNEKNFSKNGKQKLNSDPHDKFIKLIQENEDDTLDAFQILNDIHNSGILPDLSMYKQLIEMSFKFNQIDLFKKLHKEICAYSSHIELDEGYYNLIFKGLTKCLVSDPKEMQKEISVYKEEMNIKGVKLGRESFDHIIEGCLNIHNLQMAMDYYRQMRDYHNIPSCVKISANLIKSYSLCNNELEMLTHVNEIYYKMKIDRIQPNLEIYSTLSKIYKKNKMFEESSQLYESIPNKLIEIADINLHNNQLLALLELKQYDKLFSLFDKIKRLSEEIISFARPNIKTYTILLTGMIKDKKIEDAKHFYKFLKENYSNSLDLVFFNSIAETFGNCNEFEMALNTINDIKSFRMEKDVMTYSILMRIFSIQGNEEKSILTLDEMLRSNSYIKPNISIYLPLMMLFIKQRKIVQAIGMFTDMKLNQCNPDVKIYTLIISACLSSNIVDKAAELIIDADKKKIKLDGQIYKNTLDGVNRSVKLKPQDRDRYLKTLTEIMNE